MKTEQALYRPTVCPDLAELSEQAARFFVDVARQAVGREGRFTVCLSGGSTPRSTYGLLVREPLRNAVSWRHVHIFWGDERCIPSDDPDNHYRMAWDLMLSKLPLPAENIHPVRGAASNPEGAAVEYEALLQSFFGLASHGIPSFDLIFLGMGADGHIASLFPGSAGLSESRRLVVSHYVSQLQATRLTLTLPVLNHARQIIFLVSGESKAPALRAVLQGGGTQEELPARLVRPVSGRVLWLIDEAAASGLEREP